MMSVFSPQYWFSYENSCNCSQVSLNSTIFLIIIGSLISYMILSPLLIIFLFQFVDKNRK